MDQKARRRHVVPAFGEWNYYHHHHHDQLPPPPDQMMRSALVVAEWYAASYGGAAAEAEACSDVWFKYSPPPRRPTPKKARKPAEGRVAPEKVMTPYHDDDSKGRPPRAATASAFHSGRVAAKVARTPARGGGCRVVVKRAVDADLVGKTPGSHTRRNVNSNRENRKRDE